jgi:2-polyprenyl-6-methoxyphenol hydroxylase-like FAD-dependent oxidoreductase
MTYDVVIAGAGPVGLFLACELRMANVSVLVIERDQAGASPLKAPPFGMRGLSSPTTDALYRRGLLEDAVLPQPRNATSGGRRQGGHFAGIPIPFDKVDTTRWVYRLPTPAAANMPTTMDRLETVLADRAAACGVEIRRGLAVEEFQDDGDLVTLRAGGETFLARWLVGCDGGRGAVRKIGGFDFVGTDPEFTGYSVQVDLAEPNLLAMGRTYTPAGMYFQSQPGTIAMVEFDDGAAHRTPLTIDHVQAVLRRISGTDVTLNAIHMAATWTDRARQATDYRRGRVLLAGDAAHIHSPLGGQGLNLGLGDAMNLGWKLAATVKNTAPEGLLDSYSEERHPEGARILDWSRAQVALMRPSPSSRALESITRNLIDTQDGATWFAEQIWGVSLRYDLGSEHPLIGRSAPDFELTNGARLGSLLGPGKGVLLDFGTHGALQSTAQRWAERIVYVASDVKERLGVSAALVRPDGVVAWVAKAAPDLQQLSVEAARWFGSPDQVRG